MATEVSHRRQKQLLDASRQRFALSLASVIQMNSEFGASAGNEANLTEPSGDKRPIKCGSSRERRVAMTDQMCGTAVRQRDGLLVSATDEAKEQLDRTSLREEADLDDIPPSLLSYFETSRSRATFCAELILDEPEDFSDLHHTEDVMNLPTDLDQDTMTLNEQVIRDTEREENNTDTLLVPAPTEAEALFTRNVSACPNSEDEARTGDYMERTGSEYEAEQEKRHCEEMKEEQKRQIERDFQKELKKIMELEKLHQKELELMQMRAQEKLDQELLLQRELISNLQRQVAEERRRREEEQKRMKDEEEKRKREEEKIKMEAERKRMEEDIRRKEEEERKIEEMKLKKEEARKNDEEEKRGMEREEKRKREEDRNKMDLEKKKLEDEMRMMKKKNEERKKNEDVERIKKEEGKREEQRKNVEEARKKMEKEKREMETEMRLRKEEEDGKNLEEENKRIEEDWRTTTAIEQRKKQVEMRKEKEEEDARIKFHEEWMKSDKREHGNVDEEIKLEERKKKEDKDSKKMEEDYRKREKERKMIEKKEVKEVVREKDGENRQMKEELRPMEEDEKGKKEGERKAREEEQRRQKEEMRRKRDEDDCRKSEEETRLKEDKEGYGVDNRKMEHGSKTKDEAENVEAEKEENEEELGENKTEVNNKTEEELRLKENEESKKRTVQVREKEVTVVTAKLLQKKRERNSMAGENKDNNIDETEKSLASQLEDTWTCSNPGSLQSPSAVGPTSAEATPQPRDLDMNASQPSLYKCVDVENETTRPSAAPALLPVCLPERTEQKRLSWMKDCVPWAKLSLQNRRKRKGSVQRRRAPRRAAEASSLPPLCPESLLRAAGWESLQEVTTVTLEDLPGCSLSTLAQCLQLRSLTLRRCGIRSLEGLNRLPQLCYIDVQGNDISFVDCENMTSLRVLQLGHNRLTSIHGLTGAENLDVLALSHNSITRIAGLESMRRLQRLSVDHNQLISTKGLRDVYTLLHLNCSHNHLVSVEGLENSALLSTLDLRANSLTEPPSLNNQVLLRELHLDDNSISSLEALSDCWLPLMQHLSVAQNKITQLPSMSDSVSLANLDLRFNCMSELQNVCESLQGCRFLQEVQLAGNPLEQERGWRSTLQKAVPVLRAIDDQEADSFLSPPAVQQVSLAVGSFLMFCQAQLQQIHDLQQRHSRESSNVSSSLEAAKTTCRHSAEALQLAMDQRFAHEYGDTTMAVGQTTPEETLDLDSTNLEKHTERPEMESKGKVPPVIANQDNIGCSCNWTFEEKSAAESQHDTFDSITTAPKTVPAVTKATSGSVHSLATKGKTISSNPELALVATHQDLSLQNTAAVVIQQLWRKYRHISSPSTAEKGGGDGGKPESGRSYSNRSQDCAATVIQAFWRGFTLRRRLASALAAVTCLDAEEDDTFEEVDVDEFVFDEAVLEKHWTLPLSEDSPRRRSPESEQPLSPKDPGPFPEPPQHRHPPPIVWRSKQAWVAGEQMDSASPVSSVRSKSPASTSVTCGLSERSEKILEEWGFTHSHTALLMLKRAQKMKSKKQKNHRDPSVRLGLFRNCSYQLGPVEARSRPAQHSRNYIKVCEAELGLQQAEQPERAKRWLHTQAAHSDSVHFLPEISSGILNGGRVQLVADPGYTERLHHASGLWANNSLAAQPCKENNYPRRNSLGDARKEALSPKRVTSAPSKKERISFRDNPVHLSGGWGGGKKRHNV